MKPFNGHKILTNWPAADKFDKLVEHHTNSEEVMALNVIETA